MTIFTLGHITGIVQVLIALVLIATGWAPQADSLGLLMIGISTFGISHTAAQAVGRATGRY